MKIQKIFIVTFAIVTGLVFVTPVGAYGHKSFAEANLDTRKEEFRRDLKSTITQKLGEKLKNRGVKAMISGVITTVGTNSITVSTDGKSYVVNITASTQDSAGTILRRRFLGKATFAEFSVNNKVKVMGVWADEAKTTINATRVWNMSISKYRGAFVGTVVSLDSTTIVFEPVKREKHTAYLGATTKYLNRIGGNILLTDIKVGHKIKVRGTWDKSNKKVFDVISIVDMSLPPLPTKAI